jgi:hypothetical protein
MFRRKMHMPGRNVHNQRVWLGPLVAGDCEVLHENVADDALDVAATVD